MLQQYIDGPSHAIYLAVKHFRHFIEGHVFHISTDHKPLTYALGARADRHSPRQVRQLDFISQFSTDICYIRGSENSVADALSRVSVGAIQSDRPTIIDFQAKTLAQQGDQELTHLKSGTTSLVLRSMPLPTADTCTLVCATSTGNPRPYVPIEFRRSVFDALHSLSHPGISATLTSCFMWPSINTDMCRLAKTCIQCQR